MSHYALNYLAQNIGSKNDSVEDSKREVYSQEVLIIRATLKNLSHSPLFPIFSLDSMIEDDELINLEAVLENILKFVIKYLNHSHNKGSEVFFPEWIIDFPELLLLGIRYRADFQTLKRKDSWIFITEQLNQYLKQKGWRSLKLTDLEVADLVGKGFLLFYYLTSERSEFLDNLETRSEIVRVCTNAINVSRLSEVPTESLIVSFLGNPRIRNQARHFANYIIGIAIAERVDVRLSLKNENSGFLKFLLKAGLGELITLDPTPFFYKKTTMQNGRRELESEVIFSLDKLGKLYQKEGFASAVQAFKEVSRELEHLFGNDAMLKKSQQEAILIGNIITSALLTESSISLTDNEYAVLSKDEPIKLDDLTESSASILTSESLRKLIATRLSMYTNFNTTIPADLSLGDRFATHLIDNLAQGISTKQIGSIIAPGEVNTSYLWRKTLALIILTHQDAVAPYATSAREGNNVIITISGLTEFKYDISPSLEDRLNIQIQKSSKNIIIEFLDEVIGLSKVEGDDLEGDPDLLVDFLSLGDSNNLSVQEKLEIEERKLFFINHYYAYLRSSEVMSLKEYFKKYAPNLSIRFVYELRKRLIINLCLRYPKIAISKGFNVNIESKNSISTITITHKAFSKLSDKLTHLRIEKYLREA